MRKPDSEQTEREEEQLPDADVQKVAESLPAYQEFLRERNDETLTFNDI